MRQLAVPVAKSKGLEMAPSAAWVVLGCAAALRPSLAPRVRRRAVARRTAELILAEDDAPPVDLYCATTGRCLRCFPGAFIRVEPEARPIVIATPCDTPVAFAPSLGDDDGGGATWTILQDDDGRMDAVFARAAELVEAELEDCAMVRSALFPTLRGDAFDDDDEDEWDEALDAFDRDDDDDGGDDDDEVLSLVATFDVPALGADFDMMRVEQAYQVLAEKRDDGTCRAGVGRRDARGRDSALYPREREARRSDSERERGHATTTLRRRYAILDAAAADAVRPRIEEIIAESEDDLFEGGLSIDP